MKPIRNGLNFPNRSSATCSDAIPEELRQMIVTTIRQTIDSGTLPPMWAKRFEKELRAFESMRFSK